MVIIYSSSHKVLAH